MKKIIISIFILFFTIGTFAQSYNLKEDSIISHSKKKRYDIAIRYPQIVKPSTTGQRGFNKYVDKMMSNAEDTFKVWIKDWEKPPKELEGENSYYDLSYNIFYTSDRTISILFFEETYFLGAAHPNHYNYSVNFDLINNKALELKDLFTGNYVKAISNYCIKDLTKQFKGDSAGVEPDEWVVSGAGPVEDNFKRINFNETEIVITFPQYQVASYADGPQEVAIPLQQLKEFIRKDGVLNQLKIKN